MKALLASFFVLALGLALSAPSARADNGVVVSTGEMKLGALLQFWAVDDTTAPAHNDVNFRIRRAEFKLTGTVAPSSRYFLMIDPAKSPSVTGDNKILQDFGVGMTFFENVEIVAGQFKIPTLDEGLRSSGELLLPERSYIGRTYGDRRETGIMIDWNPKIVRLRVMASNGQPTPGAAATNVNDTDSSKDVHGRFEWMITETMKIGAFGSNSQSVAGNSLRTGGDFEITGARFVARVSGLTAKEINVDKTGMSVEGGFSFTDELQLAARFENHQFTSTPKSSARAVTAGVNYYVKKHNLKVQLAHTMMSHMTSVNGTFVDGSYKPGANNAGSLTILCLQTTL